MLRVAPFLSPTPPQRMEAMLSSFQSDLSSISCEIQTLQEQSVAMNVRLRNRQAVRGRLSQLVDELVVPNVMIRSGRAEGPERGRREPGGIWRGRGGDARLMLLPPPQHHPGDAGD